VDRAGEIATLKSLLHYSETESTLLGRPALGEPGLGLYVSRSTSAGGTGPDPRPAPSLGPVVRLAAARFVPHG
jgi:hypothetical protein